jgi:hypothetical protein
MPSEALLVGVDADRFARFGRDHRVQPRAAASLRPHLAFVHEAEVDHAPASHERAQLGDPIDELRAWNAVYRRRAKLGKRRIHCRVSIGRGGQPDDRQIRGGDL